MIELYERVAAAAGAYASARVVGITLNTGHLTAAEAEVAITQTQAGTGLPCTDVVRQGGAGLVGFHTSTQPTDIKDNANNKKGSAP